MYNRKAIYNLKLHEEITADHHLDRNIYALRVPGGWLYTTVSKEGVSSAFVPFKQEGEK